MEKQIFVARERELVQLDGFLKRALASQGLVCFVAGEAGSGKTALVTEFARRAQEQYADLAVAVGQSDAQTGAGDAHLPFREVLGQLTGDVEAKLAQGAITQENARRLRELLVLSGQALVEVGPDLIGVFVPGAGLVARVGTLAAEKVGLLDKLERLVGKPREGTGPADSGLQQSHIFEQYGNVLYKLSEKNPLLLLLDDLQWADTASIGLLFRLGRRIGEHRILLVGTYRPEEVAIGRAGERHPLEKVLAEFKRYYGEIWVDLERDEQVEGQFFVNAFLNTEPNQLEQGFRQKLFQHTGGHALFTIELLRTMQERGDLIRDEQGRWVETPVLDWESLPKRVEGVIEERIGRLEDNLRQMLTIGSVQGEDFTAEVVARVQTAETRGLIQRLSGELERQHRLVSALGVRRLEPAGQRLSLYRFQHNLFQKYLYNELDVAERTYLHEDVGNALEELYGDRVDEIVVQLARHFEEAGVVDKALRYLRRSGELSVARYASKEAVAYFSRALALVPEKDRAGRYGLLKAREEEYDLMGQRDAQWQDLTELEALANGLGTERQADVAEQRASYFNATGDFLASMAAAQMVVELARVGGHAGLQAEGHLDWGYALWNQGSYADARAHFEETLVVAQASGLRDLEARALGGLGLVCDMQDDEVEARHFFEQALLLTSQTRNQHAECRVLNYLNMSRLNLGEYSEAWACLEHDLRLTREIGDRYEEAFALLNLYTYFASLGDYTRARVYCDQALDIAIEIEERWYESLIRMYLADVTRCMADYARARGYGEQALNIAREVGSHNAEGWALYTLGQLNQDLGNPATARTYFEQALPLFREIGSGSNVMGSLSGLAWAAQAQGDPAQAQALVGEILAYLEAGRTLVAYARPVWIYLTCYQVLQANGDPRAPTILANAHRLLQEQAARIPNKALRRSFLENVAENRELIAEYARSQLPQ
jgi:tetratricopeptide (TPR) repeat protein